MEMTIGDAQWDMRRGYLSGSTGIVASATAWAVATAFAAFVTPERAIWSLLIGGMLIYPVSVLLCKLLGASGAHGEGNPLGQLAGASTFWLIFSLPLAYGLGLRQPTWFFLGMLLVIGGRYLVFASVYGMRLYWALGLALAASAIVLALCRAPAVFVVAAGALIELAFGATAFTQHRKWMRANNSFKPTPLRTAA
ncbi:hypothetical protein CEK69_11890 [Xanthomonas sp. LMG 12462]|uniref:DUF7010 family protein n=1 Tax=Xanthomonas sp. LMG 12462 TaxID=1591134 RepID=UPI0012655612|nr:hypothetical protein [Xanthomonas sp. LMG 12462]KAB7769981.1 hypothetical protein CEK69_11890 [Xanthomonas sp. LMG 12462]